MERTESHLVGLHLTPKSYSFESEHCDAINLKRQTIQEMLNMGCFPAFHFFPSLPYISHDNSTKGLMVAVLKQQGLDIRRCALPKAGLGWYATETFLMG